MTKIIKFLFLIIPLYFFACTKKKNDVVGIYVSRNNINTIDTIVIESNNKYINKMYRKIDNSLIYTNIGKWDTANNYIIFGDFFADEDEIHAKEFKNFEKVLITTKLPLEMKSGKIIMHHKPMYDNIYLEKIK